VTYDRNASSGEGYGISRIVVAAGVILAVWEESEGYIRPGVTLA
jgi:hypothetical protein